MIRNNTFFRHSFLTLVIGWLSFAGLFAQLPSAFSKAAVTDLNGNAINFTPEGDNKATVFYYLAPDCPLCINYSKNIRELAEEYAQKGINFYGVFTGKFYSKEEIGQYLNEYKINIPVVLDPNYTLAKAMKAKVTPEVFVYNQQGKLQYQGKIDNWIVKLGKKRTIVTEFYLSDALKSLISGSPIAVNHTDAVGCIIEYR